MVADIGIELGRMVFGWLKPSYGVYSEHPKFRILMQLVAAFLLGGVGGAAGYSNAGFFFSLPLTGILFVLGLPALLK